MEVAKARQRSYVVGVICLGALEAGSTLEIGSAFGNGDLELGQLLQLAEAGVHAILGFLIYLQRMSFDCSEELVVVQAFNVW